MQTPDRQGNGKKGGQRENAPVLRPARIGEPDERPDMRNAPDHRADPFDETSRQHEISGEAGGDSEITPVPFLRKGEQSNEEKRERKGIIVERMIRDEHCQRKGAQKQRIGDSTRFHFPPQKPQDWQGRNPFQNQIRRR